MIDIGKEAFFGCKEIREIWIPACVEFIGESCFAHCSSLLSVIFENGSCLKSIKKGAFDDCNDAVIMGAPSGMKKLCVMRVRLNSHY